MRYFERKGYAVGEAGEGYEHFLPGDLVTCTVPPNLAHIVIVSTRRRVVGGRW